MTLCAVIGCSNRSSRISLAQKKIKTRKISFHKFPRVPWRRGAWVEALGRFNWQPDYKDVVCSDHFLEVDIDRTSLSIVRLRDNAVPTLLLPGRKVTGAWVNKESKSKAKRPVGRPRKAHRETNVVDLDFKPLRAKIDVKEPLVRPLRRISKPELQDSLEVNVEGFKKILPDVKQELEEEAGDSLFPFVSNLSFVSVKNESNVDIELESGDVIPFLQ